MDFLTTAQKNYATSLLNTAFDTYKRQLLIIEHEQSVTVSSNINQNFPLFRGQDQPLEQTTYIISSGIYEGTMTWLDSQNKHNLLRSIFENERGDSQANSSSISARQDQSIVKISLPTGSGFNALNRCKIATIDNNNYVRVSSPRNRGLFDTNYYDLYFMEND